jgi:hypothetical protein
MDRRVQPRPRAPVVLDPVDQHDGVVDHDAGEQDEAEEGEDVERLPGERQQAERAADGHRHGGHHHQRRAQRLVEGRDGEEDQEEREGEGEPELTERPPQLQRLAGGGDPLVGRPRDAAQQRLRIALPAAAREGETHGGEPLLAFELGGADPAGEPGERPQGDGDGGVRPRGRRDNREEGRVVLIGRTDHDVRLDAVNADAAGGLLVQRLAHLGLQPVAVGAEGGEAGDVPGEEEGVAPLIAAEVGLAQAGCGEPRLHPAGEGGGPLGRGGRGHHLSRRPARSSDCRTALGRGSTHTSTSGRRASVDRSRP